MSVPNIGELSHPNPVYIESVKTIFLHVTKEVKMPLMHHLTTRAVAKNIGGWQSV
ncbi:MULTISPECIES: hypothetical protein [unclassified Bartonella]|uniref:hypothetical protein n=1 Tax=unclassified Bartonella TaxID=2645622 RepID=UPI0035D05633